MSRSSLSRLPGRLSGAVLALTLAAPALALTTGPAGAGQTRTAAADGARCTMTRTGEYERAEPAAEGLDPARLAEALTFADRHGSFSVKVFRHACLLAEGLRDPAFERAPANNWGQAKTVTALVAGIAADLGYVDIDAPIGTYLPDDLGDDAHRAVTLRHLLQASSGVEVNQVRGLNFYGDQSRAREFFTMPMVHEPGTYYYYDQTAVSVVVYVIQQAIWRHEAGLDFQAFVQRELFDELGIPNSAWWWQRDRAGTTTGYSQLYLRPLEFGRLGELILRGGRYHDHQVISPAFMRQFVTPAPTNCGYAFLTFLNSCRPGQPQFDVGIPTRRQLSGEPWIASAPAGMIFTDGVGTRLWVIPALDMVVTRSGEQEFDTVPALLAGNGDSVVPGRTGAEGAHEFFRLLMAAVTDMPGDVAASIANPGLYDRQPRNGFDGTHWVHPLDAAPGTYLAVGPGAPEGCDPTGCGGEANDGYQRWVSDVPRTVPGTLGVGEQRPDGH